MRKKKKITEEEYRLMLDKVTEAGRDYIKAHALLADLESTLEEHTYLKPNAQLLILRGNTIYAHGKIEEALVQFQKAEELAVKHSDIYWQAESVRMRGAMQQYLGQNIPAEKTLKQAIELFSSLNKQYNVAACLHSLSLIYNETGEFEKYIEISEEALRVLKNSGTDEITYARAYVLTLNTRSSVLRRMRLNERAKQILDEVIASHELTIAGEYARNIIMLEYGQYLSDIQQYSKSNEVLTALLIDTKGGQISLEQSKANAIIAQNMIEQERYKEGEAYIKKAIDFNRANKYYFYMSENLICHALLLMGQKKTKAAQECLKEAEALIAGTQSDYYIWQFNESYAYYFEKQKNFEKAYHHLQIAKKYEAICLRADYDKKISSIDERHMLSEKEKQNQLLQKDIEMKKQELSMASDFLNQKVELLKELKGFMKNMRKENIQKNELMKAMDRKIDAVINVEYEQQLFIEKIEISGNDFITKLRKAYPQLSLTEAKVCSLLRNNFSNKEIANLLVTSIRTIENHRYNIRKKLNIKGDDNLNRLLAEIG